MPGFMKQPCFRWRDGNCPFGPLCKWVHPPMNDNIERKCLSMDDMNPHIKSQKKQNNQGDKLVNLAQNDQVRKMEVVDDDESSSQVSTEYSLDMDGSVHSNHSNTDEDYSNLLNEG